MGRKRRPETTLVRIRVKDLKRLQAQAKISGIKLPDYLAKMARKTKL